MKTFTRRGVGRSECVCARERGRGHGRTHGRTHGRSWGAGAAAALALACGSATSLAQFTTVRSFTNLAPAGVSGDGTTLVGTLILSSFPSVELRSAVVRFDQPLTLLAQPAGVISSSATALNVDGTIVVGSLPATGSGFVSTNGGPVVPTDGPALVDVSADGTVRITAGARQVGAGPLESFPNLDAFTSLNATGLSASGAAAALTCNRFESGGGYGYGYSPGPSINIDRAARWTATGGTESLGVLPGGEDSFALGISADGAVVVGESERLVDPGDIRNRPFRWTADGGMQELPMLPGTSARGVASSASADGSVVVGQCDDVAFVWDATRGTRDLRQVLVANGQDVASWSFLSAEHVSDNGRVVVGRAINELGETVTYVADIEFVCTPPASAGSVTLRVAAVEGETAPGAGGVFAGGFGVPDLNRPGRLAINGSLAGGISTVHAGVPGEIALVARGATGLFNSPRIWALNDAGQMAVTDSRFIQEELRLVFYRGGFGGLSVLAQSGDPAPQTGGGTLRTLPQGPHPLYLTQSGNYALQSNVDGSTTTGTAAYVSRGGGVLERSFINLTGSGSALASSDIEGLDESARVLRSGRVDSASGAETLLVGGGPPTPATEFVRAGSPAPGLEDGAIFSSFDVPSIRDGRVVFYANAFPNDRALYLADAGTITRLVTRGQPIDSPPGATIATLGNSNRPALTRSGDVIFEGLVSLNNETRPAVLRWSGGTVTMLLGPGSVLPGGSVCRFATEAVLQGIDADRVLMGAKRSTGAWELVLHSSDGLTSVAAPGQAVTLPGNVAATIQTVLPFATTRAGTRRDGRGGPLAGNAAALVARVRTEANTLREVVLRADIDGLTNTCPADLNADGLVDNDDFVLFVEAYNLFDCADPTMTPTCPADFNGDETVDGSDFVLFVAAYNELLCP